MLRWIVSRCTMRRTDYAFTDLVDGRGVYYWVDRYGSHWMAQSRWGMRVPRLGVGPRQEG